MGDLHELPCLSRSTCAGRRRARRRVNRRRNCREEDARHRPSQGRRPDARHREENAAGEIDHALARVGKDGHVRRAADRHHRDPRRRGTGGRWRVRRAVGHRGRPGEAVRREDAGGRGAGIRSRHRLSQRRWPVARLHREREAGRRHPVALGPQAQPLAERREEHRAPHGQGQEAMIHLFLAAALLAAPADDNARARQLYEQGQTEFELGHYKDAIVKWEEAYRLKPVPQALYNMGQAYYKMGQLAEAAHAYKTMIAKLKSGKNVDLARQRLIQVEGELKKGGPAGPVPKESQLVTVAVAPFRTEGLDSSMQWLGKSFADALLNRLQKARSVRVVEREFLDQVLAEMKLQSSSL